MISPPRSLFNDCRPPELFEKMEGYCAYFFHGLVESPKMASRKLAFDLLKILRSASKDGIAILPDGSRWKLNVVIEFVDIDWSLEVFTTGICTTLPEAINHFGDRI